MSAVHVTRIDRARNIRRFYRLAVYPDLFGGFAAVKEWGHVGRADGSAADSSISSESIRSLRALRDVPRSFCAWDYR